ALLLPRETVTVGAGLYIVSAVLIALALYGVALIFGKGVWFLAGVNTLTGTEKKQWNIEFVGRFAGCAAIGFAILTAAAFYYFAGDSDILGYVFTAFSLIEIIAAGIYISVSPDFET
ncbi:MAG: DUF3784 domain-containing protein, partial [Candidatus Methanomethylophilus sp.]|nr:DUF3784 domain-containing protein [Methanomethylophilus sp.]